MMHDDDRDTQARARRAGFLYLFVNALYIASLIGSAAGPEEIRRPAIALMACATAATIAMAWSFYELVKPAGPGLALLALLFRVAEAALFGVLAVFSLLLLGGVVGAPGRDPAVPLMATLMVPGNVGQIYFCAGSAIFFYLLMKGRFIPRVIALFGLFATIVSAAAALVVIGAPTFAGYVAFSGPLLLAAEVVTGLWLLIAGAGRRYVPSPDPAPSAS